MDGVWRCDASSYARDARRETAEDRLRRPQRWLAPCLRPLSHSYALSLRAASVAPEIEREEVYHR